MKKQVFLFVSFILIAITTFITACIKEKSQLEYKQTNVMPQVVKSERVEVSTAAHLKQMFERMKQQQNVNGDIDITRFTFNFEEAQMHIYAGDSMRTITCTIRLDSISSVDFGVYLTPNGSISNNALLISRTFTNEENFQVIYYDAQNSTRLGGLKAIGGRLSSVEGTNLATPRGCFGRCVGDMINSFTNGGTLETITGIGCIAFGSQCAIAMTAVCAWNCR